MTADDLEDELRKLEKKYAACLEAAGSGAKTDKSSSKAIETASAPQHGKDAHTGSSIASRIQNHLDDPRPNPPHTDPPFGGYHFDESFLAMPTYATDASHRLSEASMLPNDRIKSRPTRLFSPTLRITPPNALPAGSLLVTGATDITEEERTDDRHAKRRRLKPTLEYASDRSDSAANRFVAIDGRAAGTSRKRLSTPPSTDIAHAPTLRFSRATWWDCLLGTYSAWPDARLTMMPHHAVTAEISRDVYVFFQAAPTLLSFLHVPLFFDNFCHPERRSDVQPALVLSILAYAKMVQSNHDSKRDQSPEERERTWRKSVVLRDLAQASFEASYNAGWMDLPLAQAAFILTLYEMSPHRNCTSHRMQSSAALLDNTIRAMGLTSIDALDPRTSIFTADAAPVLGRHYANGASFQLGRSSIISDLSPSESNRWQPTVITPFDLHWRPTAEQSPHQDSRGGAEAPVKCPCQDLSLSRTPELLRSTPSWGFMPRWAQNAKVEEIKKEEARRLVWSSVVMLGSNANARRAAGFPQLELHIGKPENTTGAIYSGKE
ncbi:hypothetical protein FRB96_008895 [Tulasnella sp. 330]|nr:hypothetical protein FRB96_008895 [Tulasnella sp. 330]